MTKIQDFVNGGGLIGAPLFVIAVLAIPVIVMALLCAGIVRLGLESVRCAIKT